LALLAQRTPHGIVSTGLAEKARAYSLKIHPYTVRKERQPDWSRSLEETHAFLIGDLRVDGFFTDYPDLSLKATLRAGEGTR
jgi:glycerophosphoryl diester phosphodiesterase